MIYEELPEDPEGFRRKLFNAVGADPGLASSLVDRRVNPSTGYRYPGLLRAMQGMSRICSRTPVLSSVRRWVHERTSLREGFLERMVRDEDVNRDHHPIERIPEQTRAVLREDLRKFIDLSGIELPEAWADGISTSSKS